MRGQIGQPRQLRLALHANRNRLQLLCPKEFAGRRVLGLLALQQPVPEKTLRP